MNLKPVFSGRIALFAVKHIKNIYLVIEVLLHELMDFPAAIYQIKKAN